MYPRVTAIIVAHSGGPRLERTLDAIAAQTRTPDAVIAVDCASSDDAARLLSAAQPTQLLSIPEKLAFGAAVGAAGARGSSRSVRVPRPARCRRRDVRPAE